MISFCFISLLIVCLNLHSIFSLYTDIHRLEIIFAREEQIFCFYYYWNGSSQSSHPGTLSTPHIDTSTTEQPVFSKGPEMITFEVEHVVLSIVHMETCELEVVAIGDYSNHILRRKKYI